MIQLHHDVPVCVLDSDEHGISLDLENIHKFICDLEPKIMEMEPTQTIYQQDDMTSRWTEWNLFLFKEKALHDLFKVFYRGICDIINYLESQPNRIGMKIDRNLSIGAWANLTRAGEIIPRHVHNFFLNGHIAINANNTYTIYDFDKGEVSIPNKNGQLILTLTGFCHWTSPWKDENNPRTSVAVDVLGGQTLNAGPVFPIFLP